MSAFDPSETGGVPENLPNYNSSRSKKKKSAEKARLSSMNWVKKRVRTIERRLAIKDGLPANVRYELEKELDHHKSKIGDLADHKKRRDMIKKYHMVRFFERKKATRLAKQIRSQLQTATDEEERRRLEADLHIAEVDALYAQYFPYRERYVSLYPVAQKESQNTDASSAAKIALHSERPSMWKTIEKAAEIGESALTRLVERKAPEKPGKTRSQDLQQSSIQSSVTEKGRTKSKKLSAPESRDARAAARKHQRPSDSNSDEGEDDDGGFFEEA